MARLPHQSERDRGLVTVVALSLLLGTAAAAADPPVADALPAGVVRLGSPPIYHGGGPLAFSPDSKLLATGGANQPVCVWDVATGKLSRSHEAGGSVLDLRWRPGGRLAAVTSFGDDSFLMNEWGDGPGLTRAQWQDLRRAADAAPGRGRLGRPVLSEDGGTVAADRGSEKDRRIEVYSFAPDTPSRLIEPRRSIPVATGYAHRLSRDGKVLIVHDTRGGHRLLAFDVADEKGPNTPLWEVAFHGDRHYPATVLTADGKRVVIQFVDDAVEVWDGPAGRRVRELPRADKSYLDGGGEWPGVALSPDGGRVAIIRRDKGGEVGGRVIDVATGADVVVLAPGPLPQMFGRAVFSPDGRRVAIAGSGAVRVWDARTGADASLGEGHNGPVNSVVATPDGRTVVTGGWDLTVRGWDPATGREKWRVTFPRVPIVRFATADVVVVENTWPGRVEPKPLLDPATGKARPLPGGLAEATQQAAGDWHTVPRDALLAISPDGKTAVTLERRLPALRVWSWPAGELRRTIPLQPPDKLALLSYPAASFSPDGKQLVALMLYEPQALRNGSFFAPDHTPYLERWDAATGVRLERTNLGAETTPALVGNGSRLLVVRSGGAVLDAVTGKQVAALGGIDGFPADMEYPGAMALSPDGRVLAFAAGWPGDGAVRLVDLGARRVRTSLPTGGRGRPTALTFLPDGRVVSAGAAVLVWPATAAGPP